MEKTLVVFVFFVLIILALVMLANKLKLAYPIVLVLGGLILSFTSILPEIRIEPDLVFLIFLPPLLYEAAWQTSWKEFWKWRRVIMSFAFPIVIITSCVIAFVASSFIPGFTLALGFLLGGIISPPDAVSATTIMRGVKVPRSMVSIIEGESLLNDASSLIVLQFALAAVLTGQFHLGQAATQFFLVIVMGTAIGIGVGLVFYAIHRWLPTTASIDIVLTLLTPYCMYYAAEHFHYSGVLAVVSGGLLLSNKRHRMLDYRSRLEAVNVWDSFVFILNGSIFLLIGLQLPSITAGLGNISLSSAIGYGLGISLVLIITRLACTFGASVFTRFMSRFITVADANPGWRGPMVLGWAGMRGVVSLAAALSIPLMITPTQQFPFRNLILFITFIVILVTLVFQGLTLPWLIKKVKLEERATAIPENDQELIIQQKLARTSLKYLQEKHSTVQSEHLNNLAARLQIDVDFLQQHSGNPGQSKSEALTSYEHIYLEMLEEQRNFLHTINHREEFDEDVIRKYLSLLDIEEYKVREKMLS